MIRANGLEWEYTDSLYVLKVNGDFVMETSEALQMTPNDKIVHQLITSFTLTDDLTITLEAHPKFSAIGEIVTLISMPISVGCFKVVHKSDGTCLFGTPL